MIRETAPAKVNLFLHVVGRRDDGYHLLESLVAFADFGDEVEVSPSERLSLDVTGPFATALAGESDNLVLRAARTLAQAAGRRPDVAIRLAKNLPVGAGLGGGSADAAATLRALMKLWSLDAASAEIDALALSLGADVPVCLKGRAALVRGIGEMIEPLDIKSRLPAVLVYPGHPLLTREVFAARRGAFSQPLSAQRSTDLFSVIMLKGLRNDLENAAADCLPDINQVIDSIEKNGGCQLSRMSGSGSARFGIFDTLRAAQDACRQTQEAVPSWWCQATTLGHHIGSDEAR